MLLGDTESHDGNCAYSEFEARIPIHTNSSKVRRKTVISEASFELDLIRFD
jgi:hypothetical protein